MERVELSGSNVHFLGVVRGPLSEGERVSKAVHEIHPGAVAVSLGLELLQGLEAWDGTPGEPASPEEEVYAEGMARFGAVQKPPPCFVEALRAAAEIGAKCVPLDMDDVAYTNAFTENISTWEMMRQGSFAEKKLSRWNFTAETPQSFALEFDSLLRRRKGYQRLEAARETHIAECLRALAGRHKTLLAVVEIERAGGVLDRLRATR